MEILKVTDEWEIQEELENQGSDNLNIARMHQKLNGKKVNLPLVLVQLARKATSKIVYNIQIG